MGSVFGTDGTVFASVRRAFFTHPKYEVFQRLCDPSIADKDSIASKTLTSLLFETAKVAASLCPFQIYDEICIKKFLTRSFEILWDLLPRLNQLHKESIKIPVGTGKRTMLIRPLCREKFRVFFTASMNSEKGKGGLVVGDGKVG